MVIMVIRLSFRQCTCILLLLDEVVMSLTNHDRFGWLMLPQPLRPYLFLNLEDPCPGETTSPE